MLLLLLKSKKLKTKEQLGAHASPQKGHTAGGRTDDDGDDGDEDDGDINTRQCEKKNVL